MSHSGDTERLNAVLRDAASRAAELAGGGCALIFVKGSDGSAGSAQARLRAAAGFATSDAACAAAAAVIDLVNSTVKSGEAVVADPVAAFECRGADSTRALPLSRDGLSSGVLVVASPASLSDAAQQDLSQLVWSTSILLDHPRLESEAKELRSAVLETESLANEKGDELLQLSEALFAQDIELMRNNERLSKIEKLKNDFIEKMSRELRTPLNSIIEATISVLAGENEHLSDQAKASLRSALDEGTAFQRTLQNILDLWRIKQGELPIEIQEVNFAEVVEEAIFSVQDTLDRKPVTIEKELSETLPKIKTDLTKINQVLFLLLDNAAKFTREGRIVISADVIDDELVCAIHDTGIGICPDDQEFLFEEFFQVDELTSTDYRGAGLGLTLVRDLLILLDGECVLTSEAGKGTEVTFRAPVQIA